MEALANLFVTLVAVAHTVLPQANLPQVLGVEVAEDSVRVENSAPADVRQRVQEAQKAARAKREQALTEFREKRQEAIGELQENKEEFRLRLQEIKDEQKRKIIENIDLRLTSINDKWINHWNRVLSRLTEILAKIGSKASVLSEDGKDIASVSSAIASAETAIASAQEAVNGQAGQLYVINLADEKNLGRNVASTINDFHTDIKSVLEKIKDARVAVGDALKALKGVAGEGQG
ncbi:MAG: hypothetical protein ACD_52C00076G0006 [uncultured bacterium]|uniref:Uncharacterized protein n=1 Tax=Candidatus Woesebacteria bacterium RIFCSPHIGHO2_12_FULL_41_24 TaxID=1802510 RepID=A0A1F8AU83_9BACT|nr:MAG: hypothetical protein ACD_52C00076G0006 [uncultured bacterium]OGM14331.1 MAG: hypothetical protein A2W15_02160 [Candidatus Woesebacteria bacterium RBG_16_41_13]OGM30183.1 MAG: hypothetical protein A2873_03555 [Candidatus Woesebacteria bacterium RIFCSPHIGHO2_01_FULL_42_80]OGM34230.1 MAG: hypothetical protein A3D84_04440 [Candidatus Woesebacteria bacterium RIFCSPHIGHO2_02_FULL_42_20]OGM55313.1 MAG: hypothetical protein A3E44_03455 [Candidatus Woesebacteria bacterium RIFCSPHIGHO2_12_FULL_41